MSRRNQLPTTIPPGFTQGAKFDLSTWRGGEIAVDLAGNVRCIVGYRRDDQPLDIPYYSPSVAARDKEGRTSYRFVELRSGSLSRSSFLRDETYYRLREDRWLILPSGADSYFGVISRDNRDEDSQLTRSIFGGTRENIESVAVALAKVAGRQRHEIFRLPRVTFSKTRNNRCDISGCLIPMNFPYVAFEDSQYDWSHVSLHGFYRLLSFLCSNKASPVRRALIDAGVREEILVTLVSNVEGNTHPIAFPDYL